jgi:hypothetical protein
MQHFVRVDGVEAAEMCRMVAKCFRVVNEYNLPPMLQKPKVIADWMSVFIEIMAKPEPADVSGMCGNRDIATFLLAHVFMPAAIRRFVHVDEWVMWQRKKRTIGSTLPFGKAKKPRPKY